MTAESEKARTLYAGTLAEFSGSLTGESEKVRNQLSGLIAEISGNLSAESEQARLTLAKTLEDIRGQMSSEAGMVRARVNSAVSEAAELLVGRGNEVANELLDKASTLNEAFGARSGELAKIVGTDGNELISAIETRANDLTGRLSEVHGAILEAITVKGRGRYRHVRPYRSGCDPLACRGRRPDHSRHQRTQFPRPQRFWTKPNSRLEADVSEILNKIERSNSNLQDVVSVAGNNLNDVENSLSQRAAEFRSAVDRAMVETNSTTGVISEQVSNLRDVTTTTLADIQNLTSRFGDHSEELTRAARHLEETNHSARRQDFGTPDGDRGSRRHAVGQDRSCRYAHAHLQPEPVGDPGNGGRTRPAMLPACWAQLPRPLPNRWPSSLNPCALRPAWKVRRPADAIRSAQDDIITEMTRTVSDASDRFNDAATRMRDVAREVHRELEATRAELKQGVLNLPDEAEESSAALRKVVNEQIRALTELSEIVAKQSNTLDISRPQAQAAARRGTCPGTSACPGGELCSGSTAASAARTGKSTTSGRGPVGRHASSATCPDRGGQRRAARVGSPDLLRRASRDEDASADTETARTPLQTVESLNSLSVDIARAIDHETFIDLWNRYRGGERHVFTRRLYTLQGQQTFDEIHQKYARDPEFRTAVERYVADFEQLLAQVSRNDRDNMLGQTYLTSDTGKVYTMLAHASGRLD